MPKSKEDILAILSDKPTKNDLLNFKDYSTLLADVVLNSETPSTIGIFGDWGCGKTSLMLMIDEILQKNKIKTIWFNAWKYDKEEALWRSLILSILKDLSFGKKKTDDITLKLYTAISTEKLGQFQVDWLEVGKSILEVAASFLAPLLLIPNFAARFTNASFFNSFAEAFTRRKIQQSQERVSSIEQFEELYKQLIAQSVNDGDRIVVFIDDLDRCLPGRSLEVFEALKSFLDADGCVYVVACDTRLINQGLIEKYTERTKIELDEYLGKIIQFAFTIPPIRIEDADRYLRNLGWIIGSDQIIQLISATLDRNPRKLKRFLTDLRIKAQLINSRRLDLTFEILVKMSCIAYTWKVFWLATLNDVSVFERAQNIALLPNENEKTQDDIEFGKLFQIDQRINSLLRKSPIVSQADLQAYIFLSTATSTNLPEMQGSDYKLNPTDRQRVFLRRVTNRENFNLNEYQTTQEMNIALSAIKNGTPLIFVMGKYGSGKTTLLCMIDSLIDDDYVSVYVNLLAIKVFRSTTIDWLFETARLLKQGIDEKGYSIQMDLKEDQFTFDQFENVIGVILTELKGKRFVIMFDEFTQAATGLDENQRLELAQSIAFLLKSMKNLTVILSSQTRIDKFSKSMWETLSEVENVNVELRTIYYQNLIPLFEQIISIPNEDFTFGDANELLYLLENELRYLIMTQFNSHDWWQVGIDPKLLARAVNKSDEKDISNEEKLAILSLGDLFQIVLATNNWESVFRDLFQDRKVINDKQSEILKARNSIAHSRDLPPNEMQSFVKSAKDMVRLFHSKNFL